jgi:sporulation protein YlmC with PRC-barrel domain
VGTISDLSRQNMKLQQGQLLTLYSEDLEVDGVVQYSDEENIWVAVIDWNEIREVEDIIVSNSGLPESGLILPVS